MRFSPSTIIPSEFEYLDSYDHGGSDTLFEPPFNLGPCSRLLDEGAGPVENLIDMSHCCVCGTRYRYGEVWRHVPTDLRICIGHQCARRYGLMASNPEYDRKHASHIAQLERKKERRRVRRKVRAFLTENPGLGRRLKKDHRILNDLRANLMHWGSLTEKQVELVATLEEQALARQAEDAARGPKVPVPSFAQRRRLTGTVLGIRWQENAYGSSCKMVWAVQESGGHYTLYGTMPELLQDMLMAKAEDDEDLRDVIRRLKPMVSLTVSVSKSKDDPMFGFFNRPTKPEISPPGLEL